MASMWKKKEKDIQADQEGDKVFKKGILILSLIPLETLFQSHLQQGKPK